LGSTNQPDEKGLLTASCVAASGTTELSLPLEDVAPGTPNKSKKDTKHALPGSPNNQFFYGCFELDDEPTLYIGNGWKSRKNIHPLVNGWK